MGTWQKLFIVLGVGGVATYALWRLWPGKKNGNGGEYQTPDSFNYPEGNSGRDEPQYSEPPDRLVANPNEAGLPQVEEAPQAVIPQIRPPKALGLSASGGGKVPGRNAPYAGTSSGDGWDDGVVLE